MGGACMPAPAPPRAALARGNDAAFLTLGGQAGTLRSSRRRGRQFGLQTIGIGLPTTREELEKWNHVYDSQVRAALRRLRPASDSPWPRSPRRREGPRSSHDRENLRAVRLSPARRIHWQQGDSLP
jgi:hypothetical protein